MTYRCPHGDHWHAAHKAPAPGQTNAQQQNRRRNAAKAWDRQAYQPSWGWMDYR